MERKYSFICVKSLTTSSSMVGDRRIQFQNKFLHLKSPVSPEDYYDETAVVTVEHKSKPAHHEDITKSGSKIRRKRAGNTCLFCYKTCKSFWHLEIHMNSHTKEKPFSCPDCSQNFSAQAPLRAHIKSIHIGKTFSCDMCPRTFGSYENMFAHRVKHFKKRSSVKPSSDSSISKKRKEPSASVPTTLPKTKEKEPIDNSKTFKESLTTAKHIDEIENTIKNLGVQLVVNKGHRGQGLMANQTNALLLKEGNLQLQEEKFGPTSPCSSSSSSSTLTGNDMQLQIKDAPLQLNPLHALTSYQEIIEDERIINEDNENSMPDGNKEKRPDSPEFGLVSMQSIIVHKRLPVNASACSWSTKTSVKKPFPCFFCETQFSKKNRLTNHLLSNHRMSLVVASINGGMDWLRE